MQDRKGLIIGIILGGLLIVCLCCFAVFGGGALAFSQWLKQTDVFDYTYTTSIDLTPTAHVLEEQEVDEGFDGLALQTLNTLENTVVPENDPADLAVRLGGVESVPDVLIDEDAPYQVGDRKSFWILNTDTNNASQEPAVLRYVTDHAYFWIGEGVTYREQDLEALAETFENDIYPTTREFFGSEWTPGIDGDPHIYILYMPGIGFTTAGYFVSSDSVHPLAHEYSNAHEVFVFNSDNSPLGDEYTYGVLAHEFQHMIHWYRDRNETSWINEGFSEVSTLINGFDPGGFDYYYTTNTDLQLNDWPNDSNSTTAHYGASFLFMTYFLDRMGKEASQALVAHPENGLKSIDMVLEEMDAKDPITGKQLAAEDLILDWVLTNYIMDDTVMDGRFQYAIYPDAPRTYETETFYDCNPGVEPRTVHQFGVDYIRITCPGETTLHFEGARNIPLLPESAYSGDFSFWTNKGDESDMTLTQEFDFSDVEGDVTMTYQTWYDIEEDYDYVYLLASTDGKTWDFLKTPSGTDEDPSGNSYGWGYNGVSD
ncbi:MAG: immune inhibitor A, partial [Anaerolineales bacterium]